MNRKGLVILGSAPSEAFINPPGDIRAYDVITGEKKWQFHTVPLPGEFGYDTWPKEAYKYVGGVNNWARCRSTKTAAGQPSSTGAGQPPAAAAPTPSASPGQAPAVTATAPPPAAPAMSQPEVWALLAEILKGAGAAANVDVGGAGAANQEELHQCLKMLFPMTAGSMHTRLNARWDLATAIKFLEHELGYKGLYTIEASGGHEGTQAIYDVIIATL